MVPQTLPLQASPAQQAVKPGTQNEPLPLHDVVVPQTPLVQVSPEQQSVATAHEPPVV